MRPTPEAAILPPVHGADFKEERPPTGRAPSFQQWLPVLKEFSAAGGDWATFQHRFLAHQEMAGSSEAEALRALPAALDDDALAPLITAPKAERSTLQQVLRHMSTIYGPPSDIRHRFADRRKGEAESPLLFRRALLAPMKATFGRMDGEGIDALVLEKL
ncbi:unnamed protein product [Lampetra planeri]